MDDLSQVVGPLLRGVWVTVQVFVGGAAVALLMTLIFGLMRSSANLLLRWLATAYIEVFRGTSALVQLFWFGFVLPQIGQIINVNLTLPLLFVGIVVLGLNYGAYGAELLRGAIKSVPSGQTEASIALNLSPMQRMGYVILPQAALDMLPPMNNLQIELLKNTALVFFIGLNDITMMTKLLREGGTDLLLLYSLALVLYFLLALGITLLFRLLENKLGRGRRAGGLAA